jgi:hypothetical protein
MHILIVSALFPPEPVVSSQTSADIVNGLIECGHQVSVIAPFPSRPGGKLYVGYSRRLYQREKSVSFNLLRCFSMLSPTSHLLSRLDRKSVV